LFGQKDQNPTVAPAALEVSAGALIVLTAPADAE